MKKILLIGGNGYIGSRVYEHLLNFGYDVTNVDLCWFGKIFDETIELDYKDLTKEEISKYTHIILLAGHSSVSMCLDNLYSCFNNNVLNFINLVDKINEDQTLIYSSTCAVYGNNSSLVTEKDSIKEALNFYDFTKINRENIARLNPNKKLIGLRFGSVNGFSKNFRNENLVNAIATSSLKNKSLTISNGDSMRSVLGMTDACLAIEKIVANDFIKNRIYNLTSINDKIINFGLTIQKLSNAELTVNDTFKTDYSFNCSPELFEQDYDFEFKDTINSIYQDIVNNHNNILFSNKRGKITYE
jgi:nucleoside-diphosphate-sugar epimerase